MQHTSSEQELRVSVTQTNTLAEVFTDQRDSWSWTVRTRDNQWQLHQILTECLSFSKCHFSRLFFRQATISPVGPPPLYPCLFPFSLLLQPLRPQWEASDMDGFYDQQVPFMVPPSVRLCFNLSCLIFFTFVTVILIFYYRISISVDGCTQWSLVQKFIISHFTEVSHAGTILQAFQWPKKEVCWHWAGTGYWG